MKIEFDHINSQNAVRPGYETDPETIMQFARSHGATMRNNGETYYLVALYEDDGPAYWTESEIRKHFSKEKAS